MPGQRSSAFSQRGNPFRMIKVTWRCFRALVMWKKPWFLSQGPVLGASCLRRMLTANASLTGWGAILEGHSSQGLWKDQHLSWYINLLEMLAVFLALKNFLTDLRGNTYVVSYINHQGGLQSRPLCKLACQILLWSQRKLLSLRAAYIPGTHNIGADILSRQGLRPGEWRLQGTSVYVCVSRDVSLSTLVLLHASSSSRTGRDGADAAEASSVWFSPDHSAPGSPGESSPGPGSTTSHCPAVAGQSMVPRYNIPSRRASSGAPCQEGPSVPSRGLDISPPTRTMETVGLASEGAQLIDSGLSTEVVETILHSKAPSTKKLYALKWKVFTSWCSDRQLDPVNCPVGTVLQDRFTAGLTPSTLKVYVAAISAYHIPLGGMSLERETPWYLVSSMVLWGWGLQLALGCRHGIWPLSCKAFPWLPSSL